MTVIPLIITCVIAAPWAARRSRPGNDEQATPPGPDACPARPWSADVQLLAQVSAQWSPLVESQV